MSNYDELILGFDDLARSLGSTPVFNNVGEIVPIGLPEGAHPTIYVVWVGRAIGLFHNWGIASAMVTGFSGSSHKGFKSLASARRAWLQGPTAGVGQWRPPRPRPAIPTPVIPRAAPVDPGPVPRPSSRDPTSPDGEEVEWELHLSREVAVPHINDSDGGGGLESEHDSDEDRHREGYGDVAVPDDDELYWRHYDDGVARELRGEEDLLSPTISSVSSLSLSPSPSLTAGTISPGPVETPTLPVVTLSPQTTPRLTPHASPMSGSPGIRSPRPPSASTSHSRPSPRSPGVTHSTRQSSSKASASESKKASKRAVEAVTVPRPKEFFVVIRGEHPGIYMDKHTALLMLGTRPGMKLVVFKSLSRAAWYFVQQYMARKVGVPVMTSEA